MNRFLALFFLSQLHPRHSTPAVALGEIPPRNWDLPASLPALSRPHATAAPRRSSVAETARIFARLLQDIPAARSQRLLHQVHRSQRTAVFVQGKLLNGLLERTNQMSKTVFRKKTSNYATDSLRQIHRTSLHRRSYYRRQSKTLAQHPTHSQGLDAIALFARGWLRFCARICVGVFVGAFR